MHGVILFGQKEDQEKPIQVYGGHSPIKFP